MDSQGLHPDACFHKDVMNSGSMLRAKSTKRLRSVLSLGY